MKSGAGVWVGRECSLAANGFGVGWSGRGVHPRTFEVNLWNIFGLFKWEMNDRASLFCRPDSDMKV